jgi:hypothetical protein
MSSTIAISATYPGGDISNVLHSRDLGFPHGGWPTRPVRAVVGHPARGVPQYIRAEINREQGAVVAAR